MEAYNSNNSRATAPDDKVFTNGDYDNYAEIMHSINDLRRKMTKVKPNRKPTKAGKESTY